MLIHYNNMNIASEGTVGGGATRVPLGKRTNKTGCAERGGRVCPSPQLEARLSGGCSLLTREAAQGRSYPWGRLVAPV